MGNLISSHPKIIIGFGVIIISLLGFIIYKIVNRKRYRFQDYIDDDNTNEELTLRAIDYAKIRNAL